MLCLNLVCSFRKAVLAAARKAGSRSPKEINLLEIYRAVEGGTLFALHRQKPNHRCLVGKNIEVVLQEIQTQMDTAVEEVLEKITLEKVLQSVDPRSKPTRLQNV